LDSKVMELRLKQWIPILEEQARSGLSKKDWCELNGIKRSAFFKWQKELRKTLLEKNKNMYQEQSSSELALHTAPDFVEITPTGSSQQTSLNDCCVLSGDFTPAPSISIRCGKFVVEVNTDVSEQLLSKVLKVMSDV